MAAVLWSLLFVVGSALITLASHWLVRRSRRLSPIESHHEVAGFLIGIVGVVYAVLLAFVVVIVWERYHDASRNVAQEANQLGDLWQMAGGFRYEVKTPLRGAIVTYVRAVADAEWPEMQRGQMSQDAFRAYIALWEQYRGIQPRSDGEQALYSESLSTMNQLSDERRTRLHDSEDHMPGVLWLALYGGAGITIAFTFLFQLRDYGLQMWMSAGVVGMIALALFLVVALAHPFAGVVRLDAHPFQEQLSRMVQ